MQAMTGNGPVSVTSAKSNHRADEPTGILVLGMHRSGTSALAGVLGLLGFHMGRQLVPANLANQKGHFEAESIVKHHNLLLNRMSSAWDDFLRVESGEDMSDQANVLAGLLLEEFPERTPAALKDPRMCRFAHVAVQAMKVAGWQP